MKWTSQEIAYLLECLQSSKTSPEAIEKYNKKYFPRSISSIRKKAASEWGKSLSELLKAKEIQIIAPPPELNHEEKVEINALKKQISSLRSDLNEAYKQATTSEKLMNLIHEIKGKSFNKKPSWTYKKKSLNTIGIPTLNISDIHFDETVHKAQVNGMNDFDHDIAVKRINFTFQEATDILMNRYANPKYDGFHLILNGDLFSGNIHEELRETNHQPILKSLVDLRGVLYQNIKNLVDVFGKVFITCEPGNHGRMDKKPRAKNKVFDNYEWLLYQNLAQDFIDDDRVTFLIEDAWECTYEIYNTRYFQTHGDCFKGGSGIGGILVPILRGMAKKQQIYSAIKKTFDVMVIGHFHQLIMMDNLVVNGTIKGMDEWCLQMGFSYQRPQQGLWVNHPEHGMILKTKILCDAYEGGYEAP